MTPFKLARYRGQDDAPVTKSFRDVSGGQNTRIARNIIAQNQAFELTNVDIIVPGERNKMRGSVLIGDDVSNDSVVKTFDYQRQGYTDNLIMIDNQTLRASESEGNWATVKNDFTASLSDYGIERVKESGLIPDDVIIVQNGTDNAIRLHKNSSDVWAEQDLGSTAGTGSDSPPKSTVMCWYGNRLWVLKNDLLYFSSAYPADYSTAFDTVNDAYRVPVGEERFLIPTRDLGIIIGGENAIWALAPSATPSATDKPEPIVTSYGAVSKQGWINAGDDIYWFAQDGLRALKRTVQDKLQSGTSYAISFFQKTEFEAIDWNYISRLAMGYFPSGNKIVTTVPTGINSFKTWIYYPATNSFSFITGWSPRSFATHKISGEERLYYGKHGNGTVYRAFHGFTDEGTTTTDGTAISMTEQGREEDFNIPHQYKNGGEIEVEASIVGNYNLTISARADQGNYSVLGTLNLEDESSPTLPVALPFTLSDDFVVRGKFHLDSLGRFRTIQYKIENSDVPTADIKIFNVTIITFVEQYDEEE